MRCVERKPYYYESHDQADKKGKLQQNVNSIKYLRNKKKTLEPGHIYTGFIDTGMGCWGNVSELPTPS